MIAIAHSSVMGNLMMFRRAALSTLGGIVLASATTAVMTALLPNLKLIPPSAEILGRTHPNILDQYIALASGAAAAYALSRKGVAAALPGVAIAAALVPPLCVVGYGLGSSQLEMAAGAMLLFLTNLAAIVFASAAVFMLLGFKPTHTNLTENVRSGVGIAVLGMVLVTVPLVFATLSSIKHMETRITVQNVLASFVTSDVAEIRDIDVRLGREHSLIEFTAYSLAESGDAAQSKARQDRLMQLLQQRLAEQLKDPFAIRALVVDSRLGEIESPDTQATADGK